MSEQTIRLDRISCRAAVFAPSPAVTITIEAGVETEPEIHLHAGGQGFWVARMAARLGASIDLCVPLGGESGAILDSLLAVNGVRVLSVPTSTANGAYVHDRRNGTRKVIAETSSPPLQRHELDDLYGVALTAGLDAGLVFITGPRNAGVLPPETFERLGRDLRQNQARVIADLSGETLEAALRGGLDLLKVSDEDLIRDGLLASRGLGATLASARDLQLRGATWVLVTRAEEPALLLTEDEELLVEGPHLAPIDQHGAGDSVFAGVGVALGAGLPLKRAIQFGVAAGALNVARHGLGTGHVREVARLAGKVRLYPVKRESADRKESSGASLLPGR